MAKTEVEFIRYVLKRVADVQQAIQADEPGIANYELELLKRELAERRASLEGA